MSLHAGLADALSDVINRAKWRWECLRRNSEYKRDYRILASADCGCWFEQRFKVSLSSITGFGAFVRLLPSGFFRPEDWSETDDVKLQELRSFQAAGMFKWGCNWLADPSIDPFKSECQATNSLTPAELINLLGSFPLVYPRFKPFDSRVSIADVAERCRNTVANLTKDPELEPLYSWIEKNVTSIFNLPAVEDLPAELRPQGWALNSRLQTHLPTDQHPLRLHPATDPEIVTSSMLQLMVGELFVSFELGRYSLPKSFERGLAVTAFTAEDVREFNTRRKRFPNYLRLAFECFKLKQDHPANQRPITDKKIAQQIEKRYPEAIDPAMIKRYRARVQTLIDEGCPW